MHEARQPIISHGQVHPLIDICTLSITPCSSVSWLLLDQNLLWGSCLAGDCCMLWSIKAARLPQQIHANIYLSDANNCRRMGLLSWQGNVIKFAGCLTSQYTFCCHVVWTIIKATPGARTVTLLMGDGTLLLCSTLLRGAPFLCWLLDGCLLASAGRGSGGF